jgi:hypothetical protein
LFVRLFAHGKTLFACEGLEITRCAIATMSRAASSYGKLVGDKGCGRYVSRATPFGPL